MYRHTQDKESINIKNDNEIGNSYRGKNCNLTATCPVGVP